MIYGAKPNNKTQYFSLPNEVFRIDLEGGEVLVYAFLLYCEDRKTYSCYPSYKTIGSHTKMTKNTVKKYVEGLEKKRLITTEQTTVKLKNGKIQNGNLLYHIRPIEEAVEYFDRMQMKQLLMESAAEQTRKRLEEYDLNHNKKQSHLILVADFPTLESDLRKEVEADCFRMISEDEMPPEECLYLLRANA